MVASMDSNSWRRMTRTSASAEATVIVAVRVPPLEQRDLSETVTLGELSDDAPADGRLQVAGHEHVEGVRPVALPHDHRAAEESLGLPEERKARELACREVLQDAPSLRHPVGPEAAAFLGHLKVR